MQYITAAELEAALGRPLTDTDRQALAAAQARPTAPTAEPRPVWLPDFFKPRPPFGGAE